MGAIAASLMLTFSLLGVLPSYAPGTPPVLGAGEGPPPFLSLVERTPTGTDAGGFDPGVVPGENLPGLPPLGDALLKQPNGGGGTDRFRVKLWDKPTGAVIYDNQTGGDDGA